MLIEFKVEDVGNGADVGTISLKKVNVIFYTYMKININNI